MTTPSPQGAPGRRRRRRGPAILLAAAAIAAALVAARLRPTRVAAVRAERRPLEQHIVVSGRVMPPARVDVASLLTGQVTDVPVTEGQHVGAGETLVQLDDREASAALRQAKAGVLQAQARIEQLERVGAVVASESLRQADARLTRAQAGLGRTRNLVGSGALAAAELEDAEHAVELAKSAREAALVQSVGASKSGADTRAAVAGLERAKAELETSTLQFERTRITAPRSALVLTRNVEPGQIVQPARALLTLALDGDVQLEVQPDERNLARLSLGQPAVATADAFPDRPFDAVVSYVAPLVDAQRGTVDVRLKVSSAAPPGLRPDMTVSVDILVGRLDRALVVPADAVRDLATAAPWVLVAAGQRAVRRELKVGLRGQGMVEVVGGLAEGEAVLIPQGKNVMSGQRVTYELSGS